MMGRMDDGIGDKSPERHAGGHFVGASKRNADVPVGSSERIANEEGEKKDADEDVGVPSDAGGDVSVPREWYSRGVERRRRIEQWLDAGMGCSALDCPAMARKVEESLLHFDGERYRLLAWCVMPNHVDVLVEPVIALGTIVQGWKSVTSRWALARNEELRLGIPNAHQFWMREYFDRYMRDEEHLERSLEYIHNNPVKAGLCERAEDWRWSSAWKG
jgi:REP element-mobilizing transposase RayT